MIYDAYCKTLRRWNAFAFQVLADRAYGKLKETHQVDVSPYKDVPAEDLAKEIKRLEVHLGYAKPEEVVPPLSGGWGNPTEQKKAPKLASRALKTTFYAGFVLTIHNLR